MSKTYQKKDRRGEASSPVVVPEQALVSLTELAESAREGLLALSVGVGTQVLDSIMEDDVVGCAGRGAGTIRTGSSIGTGWKMHLAHLRSHLEARAET